ncbi:uncharacterized protein [Zea mays]|nr:uncharacterized protein LOC100276868 isoform X7 [Zea mays]
MLETSAEKHTTIMGHDHMSRIKMHMAEGSFGDRNRCQQPGCNEVVDGRVVYCKTHSGELSCQQFSHLQSGLESSVPCTEQELHVKHEGDDRGMFCKNDSCSKQAHENSIYCKLHSGVSKGCMVRGCTRGAHGGTPLCIGHGGGKRCVIPGCPNAACGQGLSDRCVRHGGGRRCRFEGCAKGAQGNTDYCIRHGGGRRCKFEGCTKSAQGRTDFCIKHGGGSRCKFQGCGTSAKWGTDFCSIHRKALLGGDNAAVPEALPAASEKRRRAKKPKKAAKLSEASQENATAAAAIAGNSTQHMGGLLIAIPVANRDMLTKAVAATGQAAIASAQIVAPLSMKSPTPSGAAAATLTGREAGASREMLGL